jgi:hypothetical protein
MVVSNVAVCFVYSHDSAYEPLGAAAVQHQLQLELQGSSRLISLAFQDNLDLMQEQLPGWLSRPARAGRWHRPAGVCAV